MENGVNVENPGWSQDQIDTAREMFARGATPAEVSKAIGKHRDAARLYGLRHGFYDGDPRRPPMTEDEKAEAKRMRVKESASIKEIADRFDRAPRTIRQIFQVMARDEPEIETAGPRFTAAERDAVLALRARGMCHDSIAAAAGIRRSAVEFYLDGEETDDLRRGPLPVGHPITRAALDGARC